MSYRGVLFGLALLSPVLFQSIAVAQPAPQSVDEKNGFAAVLAQADSGPPFVPGDLVALGPFKETENVRSLSLRVYPNVFEIVKSRNGKLKVAYLRRSTRMVEFLDPRVDETSGAIILEKPRRGGYGPGLFVVVSESIANEFPIVTHWKQALNEGRGGREIGGTDALESIAKKDQINYLPARPDFYDDNNNSNSAPLWSRKYALFSPDNNAALPAYETYPGEGHSFFGLSTDWAKEFSRLRFLDILFSVRHLNGRDGCRLGDVIRGAPFFQVVHACPIGQGDKMSLATLVIPRLWNPRERYPVLFYPDRDLNFSFWTYGKYIVTSIDETIKQTGKGAIGVVWNAGAGYGSSGLQRSMYDNASLLFDSLKASFSADTDKIIAVGCSRGASEALAIAGNPHSPSYKVREVLAYSPDVAYGTRYSQFTSRTYPGMIYNHGVFTGYKYAWREQFREERTGYRGFEVILKNTFDTVDPDLADQRSPISDAILVATKAAGTRITLSIDTHDQFMPFGNYIQYVNKAKSPPYDIPMRVRIKYRGIHCDNMFAELEAESVAALARAHADEHTFPSEIEYYAPVLPGRSDHGAPPGYIQIHDHPVAISLPRLVTPNGSFLYSVSGRPGVYFKLEIFKCPVNKISCVRNGTPIRDLPIQDFSGQLPQMRDPLAPLKISTVTKRLKWPTSVPVGSYYYYTLKYRFENTEWKVARYVPPRSRPVGRVVLEPKVSSKVYCDQINCFAVGGSGLSSR
jgi:hypothetical protein